MENVARRRFYFPIEHRYSLKKKKLKIHFLKWIKFAFIRYFTFWFKKAHRPYAPPSNRYEDILTQKSEPCLVQRQFQSFVSPPLR